MSVCIWPPARLLALKLKFIELTEVFLPVVDESSRRVLPLDPHRLRLFLRLNHLGWRFKLLCLLQLKSF